MANINPRLQDLVGQLGTSPQAVEQQLVRLRRAPLPALENLRTAFDAAGIDANKFARGMADGRVEIPAFGFHPSPREVFAQLQPFVGGAYYDGPETASHPSSKDPTRALLHKRRTRGARLARLVQNDDRVRGAVERAVGGTVVNDGRADGRLTIQRTPPGPKSGAATGSSVSAMSSSSTGGGSLDFYELFDRMDREIMAAAAKLGVGTTSGYLGSGSGGKGGALGSLGSASGGTPGDSLFLPLGMTGLEQPTAGGPDSGSVDTATLELKRMLDKREQMINLYRAQFDKYNESAKQIIDAMRA